MCKAKELSQRLLNTYDEIDREYNRLNSLSSNIELKQQDVLHHIENSIFSASSGYMLAKQLKDIRNERRKIKDELDAMKSLKTRIQQHKDTFIQANKAIIRIEETSKHKTYTNRVLKEVI